MKLEDLQEALRNAGFDPGPVDGVIGRQTRVAVRAFQKKNRLRVDGIIGPVTRSLLRDFHDGDDDEEQDGEDKEEVLGKATTNKLVGNDGTDQPKAKRLIHTIVVHCTATPEGREFSREQINQMHLDRGFKKIGYHRLFHLDGSVDIGRMDEEIGAHVAGHNVGTLGFSYVGGLNRFGKAKDTRTPQQKDSLKRVILSTALKYQPRAIVGHRDLSPDTDHDGVVEPWEWVKQCPCFNAVPEYAHLLRKKK
jgi:N-acetylmuramoyl-L-alanine amidase